VTIADSSTTPVAIPGLTATSGSLAIFVVAQATGGSRCSGMIVSNGAQASLNLVVVAGTTVAVTGTNTNERVNIRWAAGSAPPLFHRIPRSPSSGANLVYTVYYILYP